MKAKFFKIGTLIIAGLLILASSFIILSKPSLEDTDKTNLVIRAIGDEILKHSGDYSSRVLPVKQLAKNTFQLEFQKTFSFVPDSLVNIIRKHLNIHQINQSYRVKVMECQSQNIVYGYEINPQIKTDVACLGREQTKACYLIQIVFLDNKADNYLANNYLGIFLLVVGAALFLTLRPKAQEKKVAVNNDESNAVWVGKYLFDAQAASLKTNSETIMLSDKESQLLQLFVNQPNQLLARDYLLKEVWEKQGIFVGERTLDVFVSKLRKKIQNDKSLKINNIHGKGYKLETTLVAQTSE
jgi:DNA-binding winged helix-turn-helix (wHTH) protein